MTTPRPSRRVLRAIGVLALTTLLLLEVVLQVGALVVAWQYSGAAVGAAADSRRRVLCVGDSFTYGLGASDPEHTAYPAQLQRRLDSLRPDVFGVTNEGYPGRNSRGVLERIDAQLARLRPEFVVVLVGLNDRWSKPDRLDLGATPGAATTDQRGFRIEWRTRRFVLWLLGRLRGDGAAPPATTVGTGLAGVTPFTPRLAPEDPRRTQTSDSTAAELARSVRALPSSPSGEELPMLRGAAIRLAADEPALALIAAVRAFVLTGDAARFAFELASRAVPYSPEELVAALGTLDVDRGTREAVSQAFAEPLGWQQADGLWLHPASGRRAVLVTPRWLEAGPELTEMFATHRAHLTQIFARCRAAGATPLLLGYPNRISFPDELLASIADESNVPFVPTVGPFEARMAGADPAQWFVADGHCNDAGYGVLAGIVADWLARH